MDSLHFRQDHLTSLLFPFLFYVLFLGLSRTVFPEEIDQQSRELAEMLAYFFPMLYVGFFWGLIDPLLGLLEASGTFDPILRVLEGRSGLS